MKENCAVIFSRTPSDESPAWCLAQDGVQLFASYWNTFNVCALLSSPRCTADLMVLLREVRCSHVPVNVCGLWSFPGALLTSWCIARGDMQPCASHGENLVE